MNIWKKLHQEQCKKSIVCALTGLASSMLFVGCGFGSGNSVSDNAVDSNLEVIEVSSTEEFLDAIAPDTNIVFKKGTYDFTPDIEKLAGKKFEKNHDYVRLEECYDGIQIVIHDVEGLTISGEDGKKVEIQVEPRYADVLAFEDCTDITLNNMIIGHTPEQGNCVGEVLQFDRCETVNLTNLDLYGCGTYGIYSMESEGLEVSDSIIRDCSYGIMYMSQSDAKFTSCEMKGCDGYEMLILDECDATFNKCTFDENIISEYKFIADYCLEKSSISFKKCTFGEAETKSICKDKDFYEQNGVSFDSKCTFAEGAYKDGEVHSVSELLEAIEPGAEIVIASGYYNISDYLNTVDVDTWNDEHEYVKIYEVYDGLEVSIENVDLLTISSADLDYADVELVVDPRYAEVLSFYQCEDIGLLGITMGHTDRGECDGAVIELDSCTNVLLCNLDLYGCGVYGLQTMNSGNILSSYCIMRDCSYGPFSISDSIGEISFENCEFTGSVYYGYITPSPYDVSFDTCTFGDMESIVIYNPWTKFTNCTFTDGYASYRPEGELILEDLSLEKASFTDLYGENDSDLYWQGFEVIDHDSDQTYYLPYYDTRKYALGMYSELALLKDGVGFVKGYPNSPDDPNNEEYKTYFNWKVSDDGTYVIIYTPEEPIERNLYFYDSEDLWGTVLKLELDGLELWYLSW